MVDPVVALDGDSYSSAAIQDWFRWGQLSSPSHSGTNELLASDQLVPNRSLRKTMEQRRNEQPMEIDPARLVDSESNTNPDSPEERLRPVCVALLQTVVFAV
jgi:hypothetical protein